MRVSKYSWVYGLTNSALRPSPLYGGRLDQVRREATDLASRGLREDPDEPTLQVRKLRLRVIH